MAVDQALELSERHEERWCLPEVLRTPPTLLLEGLVGAALAAEDCSGKRSTGRAAPLRSPTSCGPRSALAAYGAI